MSLSDEFEVYDYCTADTLQVGDLIFYDGQFIEIHSVEDNLNIDVTGYSYNEDENVEYLENHGLPYDLRLDLYKIKD